MVEILRQPEDWNYTWECDCGAKLKASGKDVRYGEVTFNPFDSEPDEFYVQCPLCKHRKVLKEKILPSKIQLKAKGR